MSSAFARIRRAPARIRRRLMAKYSFLSTSHSYFITPFSALSTNAGYARPRHTHSHARHFNALSALFSPHPSRHRKTPGLHALARGSVAGNRYHPATYPDGVDRSGISPTCGKDRGNLQGRKAFSATTHELLDALRNRRFTVAAARAVFYIRGRSSDRMTRWVPHPPGRAVSVVFLPRHRFARKQNALHNASFRRGIRRGVGMCRSLSLCCIVSCRLPMTLGRFPRFPHPRGYTHWNGR